MSGPARPVNWALVARALAASGCDLTDYGTELAAPRIVCAWCRKDLGPAGPGFTADSHGLCSPPCPEAIAMGWEAA